MIVLTVAQLNFNNGLRRFQQGKPRPVEGRAIPKNGGKFEWNHWKNAGKFESNHLLVFHKKNLVASRLIIINLLTLERMLAGVPDLRLK